MPFAIPLACHQPYSDAKSHCEAGGGRLASLPAAEELDAFWAFFKKQGWIGGSDAGSDGHWQWPNGRRIGFDSRWAPGEVG